MAKAKNYPTANYTSGIAHYTKQLLNMIRYHEEK